MFHIYILYIKIIFFPVMSVAGKLSLFFLFCFHTENVQRLWMCDLKFDVASCYEEK